MENRLKSFGYALFLMLIFSSCTAYRNVKNLKPSIPKDQRGEVFEISSLEKLVEGDKLLIKSKDLKTYHVYFKQVQGEKLMGTLWKEGSKKLPTTSPFQIPITEIETLLVERVSAAATVPVVILGAMVVLIGIVVIAWSSGGGFGW